MLINVKFYLEITLASFQRLLRSCEINYEYLYSQTNAIKKYIYKLLRDWANRVLKNLQLFEFLFA